MSRLNRPKLRCEAALVLCGGKSTITLAETGGTKWKQGPALAARKEGEIFVSLALCPSFLFKLEIPRAWLSPLGSGSPAFSCDLSDYLFVLLCGSLGEIKPRKAHGGWKEKSPAQEPRLPGHDGGSGLANGLICA